MNRAFKIIILFGLVSLFGDLTYEGARSVNGAYLKLLAVNAATLGFIAGIGELLGYALRLFSGYLADRTKSYWLLTILGYLTLISVPLLSLANTWQGVAFLIVIERIGKAIRSPARDTILSQAGSQIGTGLGFGLHEAMDQVGAILGPLIFTVFFILRGREVALADYKMAYAFLWAPVVLVLFFIFLAYRAVPNPEKLEKVQKVLSDDLSKTFWLYNLFSFFATAGFVSFILLAFHFKKTGYLTDSQIPLFYALAMGIDALVALLIGRTYDILNNRGKDRGLNLLILLPAFSLLLVFFVFSQNKFFIILGLIFWAIVMGTQETIMRSAIADITSLKKRGLGYGIFNTNYGLAIFLGSFLLGWLYDRSVALVLVAVILLQLSAFIIFLLLRRKLT